MARRRQMEEGMDSAQAQSQAPGEGLIQVSSWDEWFSMCGMICPEVEAYQNRVWAYHDMMCDANGRERAFRDRHVREFWRSDKPVAPKHFVLAGKVALVLGLVCFLGLTIFWTLTRKEQGVGMLELVGMRASEAGVVAAVVAVVALVGVVVTYVIRRALMISWFRKQNPRLASAMRYVPPRYRNAFCLDTLYRMYCEYDVTSFAVAIDTLDIHIKNNPDSYVPVRILFDVPYSQADEAVDGGMGIEEDDGGDPVVTSEALPSDIRSHTREGVDNAEEALDALIGLENVKKQVRQMKRRIEFYDGTAGGQSGDNVMLLGPAGSGKALADVTPIPVNDARGYVPIGDLEVGDEVFGVDGRPCLVDGVYPQGSLAAWRVEFEGDGVLVCNDEHIFRARHGEGDDWRDLTLREMIDEGGAWYVPAAGRVLRDDLCLSTSYELSEELLLADADTREGVVERILASSAEVLGGRTTTFFDVAEARLFRTLVASVGGRCSLMREHLSDGGEAWHAHVVGAGAGDVLVRDISELGREVSMTCIHVDSPEHLYQASREHVVTHNTEVARILTKIFYDFGYIKKNRIVEVDGEYLKSPYIGQTGERTSAIVEWAMGGVLFVDEAYLLFNEKDNSSVGAEATGVLLKAMEDHRDEFVVIFAGYEDAMNRLIASNEGFASRVKHKLYFDMYSPEELTQIFELFLKKAGQHVDVIEPEARELLVSEFEVESRMPGFGNARSARNACDSLLDIHADRFIEGAEPPEKRGTITIGDVEAFVETQRTKMAADGRNFMAQNHIDESIVSMAELKSRTRSGAKDWRKAMDAMVGMERVKQEVVAFKERADFFHDNRLSDDEVVLNLEFVGPAGTGKTSVAAIVTGLLFEAGYIRENRYLDVNGDFFKASYVGQTGKRTQAVIEYSKGMVLFIDEAYLLNTNGGGGHDFGAEALGVLIDAMEKSKGELVVILAGYEREMGELMDVNTGLASRIAQVLHFESYDMRELMMIFARMAAAKGFSVDAATWPNVKGAIEAKWDRPHFGNARFVRQLVQDSISRHATRWQRGKVAEQNKLVLEAADVVIEL